MFFKEVLLATGEKLIQHGKTSVFVPYEIETLLDRRPWANWIMIALCVAVSLAFWSGSIPDDVLNELVLQRARPTQILGHMFLHAGVFHLLGNMVFLWVFGNAVCSNTSNRLYLLLFFSCGIASALVHLAMDGNPALGASGAINGIIGIVLAVYPLNRVSVFWTIFLHGGTFSMRAYGLIIVWFLFDLWGAVARSGGVAYWAHMGGLLFGFVLGLALLKLRLIETTQWDNPTMLDLCGLGEKEQS